MRKFVVLPILDQDLGIIHDLLSAEELKLGEEPSEFGLHKSYLADLQRIKAEIGWYEDTGHADVLHVTAYTTPRDLRYPDDYGPTMSEAFPIGARVIVSYPFSGKEATRGYIVGYTTGLYDFGSPSSGPGPVEETDLVVVRTDDGTCHNYHPSNIDKEDE